MRYCIKKSYVAVTLRSLFTSLMDSEVETM